MSVVYDDYLFYLRVKRLPFDSETFQRLGPSWVRPLPLSPI